VSGPDWINHPRFDINGKAANPVIEEGLRKMLQALLADGFSRIFCRETKEVPVYVTTVV
jgi:uncharacterized protein (TIGR03435 family)